MPRNSTSTITTMVDATSQWEEDMNLELATAKQTLDKVAYGSDRGG
jgi:hypothetical protein